MQCMNCERYRMQCMNCERYGRPCMDCERNRRQNVWTMRDTGGRA
jgi:hypothetical protein